MVMSEQNSFNARIKNEPEEYVEVCPEDAAADTFRDLEHVVMIMAITPSLNASSRFVVM